MINEAEKQRIRQLANSAYLGRETWAPRYLKDFLASGSLGDLNGVEADIRNQRATAQTSDLRELYELLSRLYRAATTT